MNHRLLPALAVVVLGFVGLSGCGGSGSSTGPVTVTVTPANPSVAVGSMQTFTANVVGGTSPATVVWSVTGSGTINSSSGVYTAPASVPSTNDVVTATSQGSTGSAIVNVTASQTLQVTPGGPAIGAGGSQTFTATAGGNPVGSVTWQVNGLTGGDCVAPANGATTPCHGTIDGNGNFVAPLSPPPGGFAAISAISGTDMGQTNATILYSSASLTSNGTTGQYAFQYAGSDFTSGLPLNVSGTILTSGSPTATSGTITGGEVDINSGFAGVATGVVVTGGSFNLTAGSTTGTSDGRVSMTILVNSNATTISSFTFQVALTTNQHGLLIDFDTFGTGSGTIDAQNTSTFAGSLNGNYVFTFSGLDPNEFPLFAAGAFAANGGSIPVNPTNAPTNTQDVVDQDLTTPIVTNDVSLNGTYSSTDGFGRGQMALISTTLGTLTFSYYMIDQTHANLLEIDSGSTAALVAGQIYSAPTNATALSGGIAFTAGGSSGGSDFNPYVIGGVLPLTGTSVGTGGLLDINTSSKTQTATAITTGSYINSTSSGNVPGRYTLSLTTAKGTIEFAAYTTTINTALLVQIDTNTNGSTGTAYQQTSPIALLGSFSTNLQGVGESKTLGSFEQDVSGQVVFGTNSGTPVISSGTFDLNSGASGPVMLPLNASKSTFKAPTNNRGTALLQTANGPFNITYYLVSPTTALYIDTDANRVASGVFLNQY